MKTFDLEIRVTSFGSIITWKVFLEDSTDTNKMILGWTPSSDGYLFRKFPDYKIDDDTLEVFASCHGIQGGSLTCEVLINGTIRPNKVVAKVEDKIFAKQSYQI